MPFALLAYGNGELLFGNGCLALGYYIQSLTWAAFAARVADRKRLRNIRTRINSMNQHLNQLCLSTSVRDCITSPSHR